MLLLPIANRMSYMVYWIVAIAMTLSDLQKVIQVMQALYL